MATPGMGAARGVSERERVSVEAVVRRTARELLEELGSAVGSGAEGPGISAHLEQDLGLGSLERVELISRLEARLGVRVGDAVVGEADTVRDLVRAFEAGVETTEKEGTLPRLRSGQARRAPTGEAECGEEVADWPLRGLAEAETLTDVLRIHAEAHSERVHIYLWEEEGRVTPTTYGELLSRAEAVAAALEKRGIRPRDTVALMLPTASEFFSTFLGILVAGAVPVPIYPPLRADRIEEYAERQAEILRNAEAKLLVTWKRAEAVARMMKPKAPTLRGVADAAGLIAEGTAGARPAKNGGTPGTAKDGRGPGAPQSARGGDLALLQYTSGSTGNPKGVMLTNANLLANIRAIGAAIRVRREDRAVSWLPLYHDMGLIGAWMFPMYYGLPLAVTSPVAFLTRPERWLRMVHEHRGTMAAAPNFAYELCVRKVPEEMLRELDLSSWRVAMNGAEPVNAATVERFVERFARCGFRREALLPVFGLAEASLAVTVPRIDAETGLGSGARVDRIERERFQSEGKAVQVEGRREGGQARVPVVHEVLEFVSAGVAIPGMEVKVTDAQGREVPERVEGQLWFRGPSATRGYYRNMAATAELLGKGRSGGAAGSAWVNSGDRAYIADGELFLTGRTKDIIIKAGRNIYPHEVEEIAGQVSGVRPGCVVAFGVTDAASGTERLVVVAERRAVKGGMIEDAPLAAEISRKVSEAMGLPPDIVEILPAQSIPKTSSGKLRRTETKRLYERGELGAGRARTWVQVARLAVSGVMRGIWNATRRGLGVLWGVYFLLLFVVLSAPGRLAVILAPGEKRKRQVAAVWMRTFFTLAGVWPKVRGRENLLPDKQAAVYVANHSSYLDVILLMAWLPGHYRFVAKQEVLSFPLIGYCLRVLGHVTFRRDRQEERLRQASEAAEMLRRGISLMIFAEGTFMPAPGVRPFQLGAFQAAVEAGAPVVPVSMRGVREMMRDLTWLPRPSRVAITVGPAIAPRGVGWHEAVRVRDETRAAVAEHSGEHLV